jgi:hypothetical protein
LLNRKKKDERKVISPFRKSSKPKWSRLPVTVSKPSIEEGITPGGLWNLQATMVLYQIQTTLSLFNKNTSTKYFLQQNNNTGSLPRIKVEHIQSLEKPSQHMLVYSHSHINVFFYIHKHIFSVHSYTVVCHISLIYIVTEISTIQSLM